MQRLFSTFPEGWPATALVLLRTVTVIPVFGTVARLPSTVHTGVPIVVHLLAAGASALLLLGLWTPVAGLLLAALEVCLVLLNSTDPSTHILLGTIGAALAMLGPGAWSVDARLFGRKRIRIPRR